MFSVRRWRAGARSVAAHRRRTKLARYAEERDNVRVPTLLLFGGIGGHGKLPRIGSGLVSLEIEGDVDGIAPARIPFFRQVNWASGILRKRRHWADMATVKGEAYGLLILERHRTMAYRPLTICDDCEEVAARRIERQVMYTGPGQSSGYLHGSGVSLLVIVNHQALTLSPAETGSKTTSISQLPGGNVPMQLLVCVNDCPFAVMLLTVRLTLQPFCR